MSAKEQQKHVRVSSSQSMPDVVRVTDSSFIARAEMNQEERLGTRPHRYTRRSKDTKHKAEALHIFGFDLTVLSRNWQLVVLTCGVFVAHLTYSLLIEFLFVKHNKTSDASDRMYWFFTTMQFAFISIFSFVERFSTRLSAGKLGGKTLQRRAPISMYLLLSFLTAFTIGMSNFALRWLSLPTQMLLKNAKVLSVMTVGSLLFRKHYNYVEYIAALTIVTGLGATGAASASVSVSELNSSALIVILLSLFVDAFLGNVQERVMKRYGAPTNEMVFFSHIFGFFYLLTATVVSGELTHGLTYLTESLRNFLFLCLFAFVAYVGVSFLLATVRVFGPVVAVVITSCRKLMSIFVSFLLFPKPFSWLYIVATILVLSGVILNAIGRHMHSKHKNAKLPLVNGRPMKGG